MKKTLSMITLAAFAVMLLGSCSKINERLDDLEKKVDGLENEKIASINTQVEKINSSIADLGAIRSNIQSLTDGAKAQGQDITDLQAADKALDSRIEELTKYVGDTLKAYATEEWARATFSTLEQYEKTCDTIAKIDARIGALDENLSEKIADCADSLTTWINGQFEGYYTAAEMGAKLALMKSAVDSAKAAGEITDAKADSLAVELAKVQPAIDSAKATITAEYTAAINTAITALDGKLTKQIQDEIEKVNETVTALAERVTNLEMAVDVLLGRVSALESRVQSVSIVPAYSDGSLKVENDILYIDCIITPASATKWLGPSNFTILLKGVAVTKAGVETIRIASRRDLEIDSRKGTVSIKVNIAGKIPGIDSTLTAALNVKDPHNGSDYTTEFVPAADGRLKDYYVSVDGSGNASGKDEGNAMDVAALKLLLTKWEGRIPTQVATLNGITIHLGEGEYNFAELVTMDYEGRKVKIDFVGVDTARTVITGNKDHRLFVIGSGVSVSFEKIAFRDSRSYVSTKPGILLEEGSESRFINCLIADNVNEDADPTVGHHSQAGIKTYGKSYFENCQFIGNKASYGASLTLDADATVKNCKFKDNEGIHGPGNSLYVDANCTVNVEGCKFENNKTSQMDGGAVAVSAGRLNMTNCKFTGNSNDGRRGGALYSWNNAKVTLSNCTMTGNTAGYGGAIFTQDNSELEIVGGNFGCEPEIVSGTFGSDEGGIGNSAKGGGFLYQGGNSKVNIKGSTISNNYAEGGHGGAILMGSNEGTLVCENVKFEGNHNNSKDSIAWGGAIGTTGNGKVTVRNCEFTNNFNEKYGGAAINMQGSGDGAISGCTFEGNYSKCENIPEDNNNGRYGGGALRLDSKGTVSIDSCTFKENHLNASAGYNLAYGGAVYINAKGNYRFNGCKFESNYAVRGGALCVYDENAKVYMNACSFSGNYIEFRHGTTIHIHAAGDFCMHNCAINDNTWAKSATQDWQASWVNLSDIENICLSNCSFIGSPRTSKDEVSSKQNSIVRFDGIREGIHYFVNNIVVSEDDGILNPKIRSFANYNTNDNFAYYTRRGDNNRLQNPNGGWTMIEKDDEQNIKGSNGFKKDYFEGLQWNSTDMCWKWNGNMTGGNNTGLADAETAVGYIGQISGFKAWLKQIGALYKDQLGNDRLGSWWPGAYQPTEDAPQD